MCKGTCTGNGFIRKGIIWYTTLPQSQLLLLLLMLLLLLLPLLLLLSGISAARAHHFGMVNHLCEPGKALEAALELAARITVRLIVKGVLSKRDIKEK